MKNILCYLFLLFVASIDADSRFRCDYTYFKSAEGYLKFMEIPSNWHEARLRCRLEGGNLASPLTPGLKEAMMNLTERRKIECAIHTGIHATFSRGDFFSIEGIPLAKIPHTWATGEPDNDKDSEQCLVMLPDGTMADARCEEPLPYLCYKKASKFMLMNQCGTIDNDYILDSRTKHCYKFHKVGRTWSRAYMACAAEGGSLAIINSETEAQVIRDIFAKNPAGLIPGPFLKDSAFVGFYDWRERGDFLTIEGETLTDSGYAKWSGGQPDNATWNAQGEYCGAVFRNALFDDTWCERPTVFICEKTIDSLLCDQESK